MAEQAIIEQWRFLVGIEQFQAFLALLDQPEQDNDGLKDLFSRPDPWSYSVGWAERSDAHHPHAHRFHGWP